MLQRLRESISRVTIQQENCTKSLSILAELCDIKPQGNQLRPICVLVRRCTCVVHAYIYKMNRVDNIRSINL